MNRKNDLEIITDWIPFIIDGCEVEVYFTSAYDAPAEAEPEAMEQTLIAAYKNSSVSLK